MYVLKGMITNQCSVLSEISKCKQIEKACTYAKYIVEVLKFSRKDQF